MNAGVCTLSEARDIARQLFDKYDKNKNSQIDNNEGSLPSYHF